MDKTERLIAAHRALLAQQGNDRVQRWNRLQRKDSEAALCEAAVCDVLLGFGVEVLCYEDASTGGPDFLCKSPSGHQFFVEATCLSVGAVARHTGLPHPFVPERPTNYGPLTGAILDACRKKTPQCANLPHPCLLAVATLHRHASSVCFSRPKVEEDLHGSTYITHAVNLTTGRAGPGYLSTKLENSSFLRPGRSAEAGIEFARLPVSGLLLLGLGREPPPILGVLHPSPIRPFDRQILPRVEFCQLAIDQATGMLTPEWI